MGLILGLLSKHDFGSIFVGFPDAFWITILVKAIINLAIATVFGVVLLKGSKEVSIRLLKQL